MKLYFSQASPFVRKVRMAAFELGIHDQIELVDTPVAPTRPNAEYGQSVNPLRKVPALSLADGSVLFDSTVITEYLDSLVEKPILFPAQGPERWQVRSRHAAANGMTELLVQIRYETFMRPENYQWSVWIDDLMDKVNNGLEWFNGRVDTGAVGLEDSLDIADIALACQLGYLDFRSPDYDWRARFEQLAAWHAQVALRQSYSDTLPE